MILEPLTWLRDIQDGLSRSTEKEQCTSIIQNKIWYHKKYLQKMKENNLYTIDVRKGINRLENNSIQCIVTSPPYYLLRDYGTKGQLGQEKTPEHYIETLVKIFLKLKLKLKQDGTLWLNIADTYCGNAPTRSLRDSQHKRKDLYGIPWSVALALKKAGWYLRQDIIWEKPNPTPESVKDRCTKSHEYIFLLTRSAKYYFNAEAIMQPLKESSIKRLQQDINKQKGSTRIPGKRNGPFKPFGNKCANRRSVWCIPSLSHHDDHCATFPSMIAKLCILAGTKEGDIVLDPFAGRGTTLITAKELNRKYIGFDNNSAYVKIARNHLSKMQK